jgi:hypothetical protein
MTPAGHAGEVRAPGAVERPVYRWYHKLAAIIFITLCLEIGFFLLVFPWTGYWGGNYFVGLARLGQWWDNLYLRGACSGLGVVNLYISVLEIFRLRRFAKG